MIESVDQAITNLQDTKLGELDRETAARYLEHHPSDAGLDALVVGLDDDDYGVRWVCAECLAGVGQKALLPLLNALSKPDNSVRLREGAHHAFKNSSSPTVSRETADLMKAFGSVDPQLATMQAAFALKAKLQL